MANIIIGTMIVTRMLERTRSALALISWLGSCKSTERHFHQPQLLLNTVYKDGFIFYFFIRIFKCIPFFYVFFLLCIKLYSLFFSSSVPFIMYLFSCICLAVIQSCEVSGLLGMIISIVYVRLCEFTDGK